MNAKIKHPKALPFLFFSEMWERFGYYLMIGIFTLYLKDVKEGFAMTEAEASDLYGTFIALVFFTPFIGGLLADRFFGYRKTIIAGGLFMAVGYCMMGIHSLPMLYLAMTLVITGNGLLKPNISTLLGNVYNSDQYKHMKDDGYNIFYMGINVGAFICNFFGAAIQTIWGWKWAFVAAGVGMFIGIGIFLWGNKHYKDVDVKKGTSKEDLPFSKIVLFILIPSLVAGIIGWLLKGITGPNNPDGNLLGSDSTDAFLFACIPVVIFFTSLYTRATQQEKKPIAALLAIFAVVITFWAVFKQNGSALNTWAQRYTDREVTGTQQKVFSNLYLTDTLTYKQKMTEKYDDAFRLQKENGQVIKEMNYPVYFRNIPAEKKPAEGSKIYVWATNLSQSINPGWVIMLTPLIVAFFTFLRRKNVEPTTPTKIALGLLITGLSSLVMFAAVKAGHNGMEKVSPWFLIGSYGVVTIGELCLSPMGLSVVSKLSPPRITALMMGGWFLATSIGNKLSGVLASMWDRYEDKGNFFLVNLALMLVAFGFMLLLIRWLNKIFREHI